VTSTAASPNSLAVRRNIFSEDYSLLQALLRWRFLPSGLPAGDTSQPTGE
jgi:hypothetical protein